MVAEVLEQSHWKSPAPSPAHRIILPILQSDFPPPDRDDSLRDERINSSKKKQAPTNMDGTGHGSSGQERSRSRTEKELVNNNGGIGLLGKFRHGAADFYRPSASTHREYRALDQPSRRDNGSEQSSSEDDMTDNEEAGLTEVELGKRRRRRRRHPSLGERIAGDGAVSKEERKLADLSVLKSSAINALLIGLWYLFSLSISIYNKWMFSPEHLNFHFPLFTTAIHMLVQFTLASIVLLCVPRFRPRHDSITNPHNLSNHTPEREPIDPKKSLMTLQFYLTRIGPCGAATGLDIGLGNMSLKFITLTFFTMCKSSALAFVLLFAFIFHLETPSIKLCLIILTMTIGVIMMVAGETAFNALGFILIISSAFFSGFRWALTQILLLRNPATGNPFSSIFFLAPIMFLSLALLAIPIEGVSQLSEGIAMLVTQKGRLMGVAMLLFPGCLAFCMTSAEFALLQRTSVVTLSICGIFKEVITISAAGIVFHDPLTPINVSGLLVTIASIAAYNFIKITKMRREARERLRAEEPEVEGMLEGVVVTENGVNREDRHVRARRSTSSVLRRESLTLAGPGAEEVNDGEREDRQERLSPTKRPADWE